MRSVSGIFLGLISLDVTSITAFPIPKNKKSRGLPVTLDTGGPAANAARAFADLGGNAWFASFGDVTPFASVLWTMYREGNPNIEAVRFSASGDPTIANILVDKENGDRSILANGQPVADAITGVSAPVFKADIALLDGYHFSDFLPIITALKDAGVYMVLDGGSWKDDVAGHLDLIDCAILSNDFKVPGDADPVAFLQQAGIANVVVTSGGDTVRAQIGQEQLRFDPPATTAIDTLGAGDMFHGAFCFYFARSRDIEFSLRQAAIYASESVTYFGLRSFFESSGK